ncbi:transposase [Streptomyces sp. NPDC058442]|uniref:transposase n=1 Tax=Streptomyces sp. NPDC058442 TaxID=3346503 RepID=UPI00364BFA38
MSTRPWIVDDDLWALIEPLLPPWPERSPGPQSVADRLCLQGVLYVLHNDMAWQHPPLKPGFGSSTDPSPVDRRKTGGKHSPAPRWPRHPAQGRHHRGPRQCRHPDPCPGRRHPPVAGRPGRPCRRPEALLGDKGDDSRPNREELHKRRILPAVSRKGAPDIKGLDKLRYVVEQTFALFHRFERLAVRWERRTEPTMSLPSWPAV